MGILQFLAGVSSGSVPSLRRGRAKLRGSAARYPCACFPDHVHELYTSIHQCPELIRVHAPVVVGIAHQSPELIRVHVFPRPLIRATLSRWLKSSNCAMILDAVSRIGTLCLMMSIQPPPAAQPNPLGILIGENLPSSAASIH